MRMAALLLVLVAVTLAVAEAPVAGADHVRAQNAAGAASSRAPVRSWQLTLSPSPSDVALAVVRLPARRGASISRRTLQAAVHGPFGADYLALAALRTRSGNARIAFVLLVNRATALLDPAVVRVRMRSARALGTPTVVVMSNPFSQPLENPAGPRPAVKHTWPCALTSPRLFPASALVPISSRGTPVAGFGLTQAVAASYESVCGARTHPSAFEQTVHPAPPTCVSPTPCCAPAVACCASGTPCCVSGTLCCASGTPASTTPCCASGTVCCPPNAICAPPPAEPPQKCPPCAPRTGFVCPLAKAAFVCVGRAARRAPRAAAPSAR